MINILILEIMADGRKMKYKKGSLKRIERKNSKKSIAISKNAHSSQVEKEMVTHSSTFAWKIPWMRTLVGYSLWGRKESDMTESLHFLKLRGIST